MLKFREFWFVARRMFFYLHQGITFYFLSCICGIVVMIPVALLAVLTGIGNVMDAITPVGVVMLLGFLGSPIVAAKMPELWKTPPYRNAEELELWKQKVGSK